MCFKDSLASHDVFIVLDTPKRFIASYKSIMCIFYSMKVEKISQDQ